MTLPVPSLCWENKQLATSQVVDSVIWNLNCFSLTLGAGAKSEIFKSSSFGSVSGAYFYVMYILIYFDGFISKKTCRMLN